METEYEVIIVGAGIAGLTAARELSKHDINYLVIEGHSDVGGRVRSIQWEGATIELGA